MARLKKTPPGKRPQLAVAGIAFDAERQSVLLVKRGHEPAKGQWSLPGGRVEAGESLEIALQREFREEVGLEVAVRRLICPFEILTPNHFVILDFCVEVRGGDLRAGDDADDAAWWKIDDLPSLNLSDGLVDVIQRSLKG